MELGGLSVHHRLTKAEPELIVAERTCEAFDLSVLAHTRAPSV